MDETVKARRRTRPVPRWLGMAAAVLLATALAGCYMPVRFDAEISINRYGAYDMQFDGYMASVQLFDALRKKELTKEEEEKKVEAIRTDFKRDSATKAFKYYKLGHFKVTWHKAGDILQSRMVTFFRRNENILSISYVKDKGQITVQATPIGPERAKTIVNMGLNMQGQLRIRTDARVVSNNATRQTKPRNPTSPAEKLYIWDIKSVTDPPPRLSLFLR